MSKAALLRPRLNEKTYALAGSRVYVFEVDKGLNKHLIARSVEDQFEVKVATVNTLNNKGKSKRTISLSGKRILYKPGSRRDSKRAYVTLKEGFSLPFFEAIEEETKKEEETQAKVEKAIAKQAEKDVKPKRGILRRTKQDRGGK
jgi:large subunit ribosomal protein L23